MTPPGPGPDDFTQPSGEHEEPAPIDELARGTAIGRYLVLQRLAFGGMGVIYSAYDPELDRKVALKLVRSSQVDDPGQARLTREAQAMAKVEHPNVVTVHEVGTWWGRIFIAMELVEGVTLTQWLAERPRSWREIVAVFTEAGQGLAAAHAAGLVHRDFKPDNVLVGKDGRARVTDFGLVRPAGEDALVSPGIAPSPNQVTLPGVVMGSPPYMAPEQMEGAATDARADQFAFAVALYEALYGARPFVGSRLPAQYEAIKNRTVQPPVAGRRAPPYLRKVLLRALSFRPDERYPSIADLLSALGRDPRARARRVATLCAVMALALSGPAFAVWYGLHDARRCDRVGGELDGVWDDARRAQLGRVYAASSLDVSDTWAKAQQWLDQYRADWVAARRQSCELARRGTENQRLTAARETCLARMKLQLEATVDLLAKGDPATLGLSWHAFANLGAPKVCAFDRPQPGPPASAPEPLERERRVARVWVLNRLGRFADAEAEGGPVAEEAISHGEHALAAEALRAVGQAQHEREQGQEAAATLRRALLEAEAGGDDTQLFYARLDLAWVLADHFEQFDQALWELDQAKASEAFYTPEREAQWELQKAMVLSDADRPLESLPHGERALKLQRSTVRNEWELSWTMGELATLYSNHGEMTKAAKLYGEEIRLEKSIDAPTIDTCRHQLYLGEVEILEGEYTQGISDIVSSRLGVPEAGKDAIDTVHARAWMARAQAALGQFDRASQTRELARADRGRLERPEEQGELISETAYLPLFAGRWSAVEAAMAEEAELLASVRELNRDEWIESTELLAEALRRSGKPEAAAQALAPLLAEEAQLEKDFPTDVQSLKARAGWLALAQGKPVAPEEFSNAAEAIERALGPGSAELLFPLMGQARLARESGRREEGLALSRRAVALAERAPGDLYALAEARFELARALAEDPAQRAQAAQLAASVETGLAKLAEPAPLRGEVARWLESHRR